MLLVGTHRQLMYTKCLHQRAKQKHWVTQTEINTLYRQKSLATLPLKSSPRIENSVAMCSDALLSTLTNLVSVQTLLPSLRLSRPSYTEYWNMLPTNLYFNSTNRSILQIFMFRAQIHDQVDKFGIYGIAVNHKVGRLDIVMVLKELKKNDPTLVRQCCTLGDHIMGGIIW